MKFISQNQRFITLTPDTVYQSVLYYAEFTLCNKLLERVKIFYTNRKQFHLALNEFIFGTPCNVLMIL